MTFVLTATKVLNILSKTLKDAVSGFFEFYSLREGGGLFNGRFSVRAFDAEVPRKKRSDPFQESLH